MKRTFLGLQQEMKLPKLGPSILWLKRKKYTCGTLMWIEQTPTLYPKYPLHVHWQETSTGNQEGDLQQPTHAVAHDCRLFSNCSMTKGSTTVMIRSLLIALDQSVICQIKVIAKTGCRTGPARESSFKEGFQLLIAESFNTGASSTGMVDPFKMRYCQIHNGANGLSTKSSSNRYRTDGHLGGTNILSGCFQFS